MNWGGTGGDWEALGLGADERLLYEELLRTPSHPTRDALAEAVGLSGGRVADVLARLAGQGFTVAPGSGRELPAAVPPATALRNLIHLRQAELLRRSAELETLSASVDRVAAHLAGEAGGERVVGIETIRGSREIGARVQAMMASATTRLTLLDRPPYASSAPDGMPEPLRMGDLVRRGVDVMAVVDREGLSFPGRARGLNELAEEGVRIRVASDLPTKLISVDGRVALLPPTDAADPTASALVVSDVLLRNALVPLFEAIWDRAMPIGPQAQDEVTVEDRELLTMLASGLKDEAIARRLDIHVHTVRRRIRRLLETLDAETRFQAGVQALRRGWLTL
ncbi:LuxR C-terminal-related transcriptional regulator [Streptomyces sp. NPDC051940]|uniref:helix-turn-helix transcriptional regulator n=1 Tax=Streptomyces sp. NPDC051940 TaxID=3155675 RepID=UPI003434C6B3